MSDNPIKTIILSILFFGCLLFEWSCSHFIWNVFATKLADLTLGLIVLGLIAIGAWFVVAFIALMLLLGIFDW